MKRETSSSGSPLDQAEAHAPANAADSAGFHPEPVITQSSWLLTLGIAQVAEQLETAGFMAALEGLIEEATVLQGELSQLMELGDTQGLGSLLVLRAAKDAPPLC